MINIFIKRKVKIDMGKKIAKLIGDGTSFKYYGPAMYLGKYNNYDIVIKYDGASMLYNVYFNISNFKNINKLNDLLGKIDKYCIAKNKNNSLIITESCDYAKDMAVLANKVLDVVTKYLKNNKCLNLCRECNNKNITSIVKIDDSVVFLCDECYAKNSEDYEQQVITNKQIK